MVVAILGGGMLLYLIPSRPGHRHRHLASDTVASVGEQNVTMAEVRQQLAQIEQRNPLSRQLDGLYTQQIVKQLIFQKELEYESKRLGITVSDQERADRIRQFLPTAFNGDSFVGIDRYTQEVHNTLSTYRPGV